MKPQTSWRMLAISAAVAVMLTACGGGSNGSNGAAGANVPGNGDDTAPANAAVASTRLTRDGNTVTVELLDAAGNIVPISGAYEITLTGGATFPGGATTDTVNINNGSATFQIEPGENGFDFELPGVTDPSTGKPVSGTVPNARFNPAPIPGGPQTKGAVGIELLDKDGNVIPGSCNAKVAITEGIGTLTSDTIDLSNGKGDFGITTTGAVTFTVTCDGNTFTGIVDTGSYVDPQTGAYVLGCNDYSPFPASFTYSILDSSGNVVVDSNSQQGQGATYNLTQGVTYTYTFTQKYYDSTGQTELTNVSREVNIRLQAGEGEVEGTQLTTPKQNSQGEDVPDETPIFMKEGSGTVQFKPTANTTNPKYPKKPQGFKIGMNDMACAKATTGWAQRRDSYETVLFNVQ